MSLRARILWLVFLAWLLPVLGMVALLVENRQATLADARRQLSAQAQALAADLDDKIMGTVQLEFGLGRVPVVLGDDRVACSQFLAEVLQAHPQYTGLLTILPNGQLHCDSLRSGRHLDLNDRTYFQQARAHPGTTAVEAAIGRLTGKGVLQIARALQDDAQGVRAVLLASLNLDALGKEVAATLTPGTNLQLWGAQGALVMDFPGPQAGPLAVEATVRAMLQPAPGGTTALTVGREPRHWVAATPRRHPEAGLRLVLSVPEAALHAQVDAPFWRTLGRVLGVSVLVFLGAVALGEWVVRRQTGRLMGAIARLDAGELDRPIGAPYPRGELGQVMVALDRLTASLAQQRALVRTHTEALERQAKFDALTGLANRHLLVDRMEQALIHARRTHRTVGVMVLDLDRFKTINDSLGHHQGDRLLQAVATLLQGCVRDGDTVARLGGDEFVLLLTDMADATAIAPIANKVLAALTQPVVVERHSLSVSTSVGISIFPRDGTVASELLRQADTAMYRAKAQGGAQFEFFTPAMNEAVSERLALESGLRRALPAGELSLHYQPIVDAHSGRIVAAEALMRWTDPLRGPVSPQQFIPVAEESGLIVPMGAWALETACRQAQAWHAQGLGPMPVAVNLSVRQFDAPTLEASVAAALQASQCPAELLQLEITESMVMARPEPALQTLARLRALGVSMSIDDFGTGYSSLHQLKRLPVAKLKIDRSFIQDLDTDPHSSVIVDAIIGLAHRLGLRTVAEGVETPAQQAFLRARQCDELQGYLLARPAPADVLTERLRGQAPRPVAAAAPAPSA